MKLAEIEHQSEANHRHALAHTQLRHDALGALCTGVAYVLYFRLIDQLGPARALTVTFTIPVFALLYGATLLGEAVTPWMLLCGGVVICGTTLATGLVKLRV